jgi:hypothetical protein
MARRYATFSLTRGWAMERCEEKGLIGQYEDIRGNVDPILTWPAEFEQGFYTDGRGVLDRHIALINKVRTRLGLVISEVRETDVGSYARRDDRPGKSAVRRQWREEYRRLDVTGRKAWQETTQREIDVLPPPHATHDQHVTKFGEKGHPIAVRGLGPSERDRREMALLTASAVNLPMATERQPNQQNDLTLRLLKVAVYSPDVLAKVITRMTADEAVSAAEQTDDVAVRDALVLHAVATMRS